MGAYRITHRAVLNPARGGKVIISSGAIRSPQLLLLSGIGPRDHLASLRISMVLDLPGVGQAVADNPRNGITLISPQPLEYSLIKSLEYFEKALTKHPVFQFPIRFMNVAGF